MGILKKYLFLPICLLVLSCSSGGSDSSNQNNDDDVDANVSALGSQVVLSYEFEGALVGDDLNVTLPFPDTYSMPLYIQDSGSVSLRAKDLPRMVLRICDSSTTRSDCDMELDDIDLDVDLVFDACGEQTDTDHSDCGDSDSTIYTGSLSSDGTLFINAIAMRIRVFAVTSSLDGYSASDTDEGLLPDLERITVKITTGSVSSGGLSDTGSPISNKQVTLVSAGIIPDDMTMVAGASYLGVVDGTFNIDPLSLIQ